MATEGSRTTFILIAVGIVGLFGIITFALAAATLGTLNKRYDALAEQIAILDSKLSTTTTTTFAPTSTTTTTPPATANNDSSLSPSSTSFVTESVIYNSTTTQTSTLPTAS